MSNEELINVVDKIQTELNNIKKTLTVDTESTVLRAPKGTTYYSAVLTNGGCGTTSCIENGNDCDTNRFKNNNYFYTCERAQEVADKVNTLLLLERLHDTYCPDYKPDWTDNKTAKYFHRFNCAINMWEVAECWRRRAAFVYFPTVEIARKVRDILNA